MDSKICKVIEAAVSPFAYLMQMFLTNEVEKNKLAQLRKNMEKRKMHLCDSLHQ
jgi:hypothetical protein